MTLSKTAERITGDFYRDFGGRKHEYFLVQNDQKKMLTGVTTVCSQLGGEGKIGSLNKWAANCAVDEIWARRKEFAWPNYTLDDDWDETRHEIEWCFYPEKIKQVLEEARTAYAKKKKDAGTHGTDAHALVEEWINTLINEGTLMRPIEEYKPIERFCEWATQYVDHFLFAERPVHSPELHLAGTIDFGFVGKDGKRYIGDFKTSSGVYDIGYFAQTAAYKMLAEGEGDEPYHGTVIVRLGKKGPQDFDVHWRYDTRIDEEAFRALLVLYRASQTFTKPKKI